MEVLERCHLAGLVLLLVHLLAPAHPAAPTPPTRLRPDLDALFAPRPGWAWLGGDSSASVALPHGQAHLWLFGDSLRGALVDGGTRRHITAMPHSSFAILNRTNATSPAFYFPPTSEGWFTPPPPPSSPPTTEIFYWLIDGAVGNASGMLFILGMVIEAVPTAPLGFAQTASDLIIVENPADRPPDRWRYTTARFPHSAPGSNCSWNEGIASQSDGYLYVMGNCAGSARLARVSERDAAAGRGLAVAAQYWSGSDEGWVPVARVAAAQPLFDSSFTEGTLKYHEAVGWHVFLCQAYDAHVRLAFGGPGGALSSGGVSPNASPSSSSSRGWNVVSVYEVPLFRRSNGTFSYAAKAHPEFANSSRSMIFSYNTNAGPGLEALVDKTWAYHPTFVEVDISQFKLVATESEYP